MRKTWYGAIAIAVVVIVKLCFAVVHLDHSDPVSDPEPTPVAVEVPPPPPPPPPPASKLLGFMVRGTQPMTPLGNYGSGHAVGHGRDEVVNWRRGTLADRASFVDTEATTLGTPERTEHAVKLDGQPAIRVTLKTERQQLDIAFVECDGRLVEMIGSDALFASFHCTPAEHTATSEIAFTAPGWTHTRMDVIDGDTYEKADSVIVATAIVAPEMAVRYAVGSYLDHTKIELQDVSQVGDRFVWTMTTEGTPGKVVAWHCNDKEIALVWFTGPDLDRAAKLVATGHCVTKT
ncbi:MAG: hypothetical protein QM831_07715 [Kofleriaceae bacterium]